MNPSPFELIDGDRRMMFNACNVQRICERLPTEGGGVEVRILDNYYILKGVPYEVAREEFIAASLKDAP